MYVKLFTSILTSSVWSEDNATRIVWITLLALADRDGDVRSSPSGLARLANVSLAECQAALAKFQAPDPEDPTQENDGRRIEERDGGWFIFKYAHYRSLQDQETRKAQWRESSKRHRQRKSAPRQQASASSQHGSAHTEADTKAEATTNTHAAQWTFAEPAHQAAYLACRNGARSPISFDAMLGTLHTPISGGAKYGWTVIGQALLELQSNGTTVTANAIRAFCRKLAQSDAPSSHARGNGKISTGRANLTAWLEQSNGQ